MKVEKNIPIPIKKCKYPIFEMEIGDSFFIECDDLKNTQKNISAIINTRIKGMNIKFTTRQQLKPKGIRIWRIK